MSVGEQRTAKETRVFSFWSRICKVPAQIGRVAVWKKQKYLGKTRVDGQSHKEWLPPVCTVQSGYMSSPEVVPGGAEQRLGDYLVRILWRGDK